MGYYADPACNQVIEEFGVQGNTCLKLFDGSQYLMFTSSVKDGIVSWGVTAYLDPTCSNQIGDTEPDINPAFESCTQIDESRYLKGSTRSTLANPEKRYVAGVKAFTSSTSDCRDSNNVAEYIYLPIHGCASLRMADGQDVSPIYCNGNQMTVHVFSSRDGSCGGAIVATQTIFANSNCNGEGTDTVIGFGYGYSNFVCQSATQMLN